MNGIQLQVPMIGQLPELPTGCEITAVAMMIQFYGINVDKEKLANEMPKHPTDPHLGYVGNPYEKSGWTIYPSALVKLIEKYCGSVEDLTGCSLSTLEKQLLSKKPVVVWVSPMHGFTVHALILTGYDESNYFFNDCWSNQKDVKIKKEEFQIIWENQARRAISY